MATACRYATPYLKTQHARIDDGGGTRTMRDIALNDRAGGETRCNRTKRATLDAAFAPGRGPHARAWREHITGRQEMNPQLSSYVTGTLGLTVVLVVSAALAFARRNVTADPRTLARVQAAAAFAIGAQLLHFLEELHSAFYLRFPVQLGLTPWTRGFFIVFNLVWLLIWVGAAAAVRTRSVLAMLPLWFLALALVLNGIAHPLLALAVDGYFPGLYTSPLVAVFGAVLLHRLARSTAAMTGRIE